MSAKWRWLESLGGPWLFAPLEIAGKWQGGFSSAVLDGPKSDYEQLCEAMAPNKQSSYLASFGTNRDFLGIGEMAEGISIVTIASLGPCLVEWFGADDDHSLADIASFAEFSPLNETCLIATSKRYVLFDSVWPWKRAPEYLVLDLPEGEYDVVARIASFPCGEFAISHFVRH